MTFDSTFPPPSNTGGKSPQIKCHPPLWKKKSDAFSCGVDWATFMVPLGNCDKVKELEPEWDCPWSEDDLVPWRHADNRDLAGTIRGDLGPFLDCLLPGVKWELEPTNPRKFFAQGWILRLVPDDAKPGQKGAQIAWIGDHQSGKWMVDVSGSGCPFWDFPKLSKALERYEAKITRLDLAADDYEGTCGVAYAMRLYKLGAFITNGHPPKSRFMTGDEGRTFYVGQKGNGKELCVYEKGRKEGSLDHPNWARWELRLGSKDRVIPWEAMREPARYFLGAFDCLADIFPRLTNATPLHIATKAREQAARTMAQAFDHARRSYGPVVHQAASLGLDAGAIIAALIRPPKELRPFLDAEECRAAIARGSATMRS